MIPRIPRWVLLSLGLLVAAALAIWIRSCDSPGREAVLLEERIKALEDSIARQRDTLASERVRTDTVLVSVEKLVPVYRDQRARVDTLLAVDTLRIDTIPPNHVVVPIEFVRAADSLAVMVDLLGARIRTERLASDSLLKLQAIEIADLKRLNRIQRGSWTTKLKWAGVGAGVALGAVTVLRN